MEGRFGGFDSSSALDEWRCRFGSSSFHRVSIKSKKAQYLLSPRSSDVCLSIIWLFVFSIAFKPAESGWGGGQKYAYNFDQIFAKNNQTSTVQDSKTTIASTSPTTGTTTDATTKSDEGKRA
jgi:hypothetical protein